MLPVRSEPEHLLKRIDELRTKRVELGQTIGRLQTVRGRFTQLQADETEAQARLDALNREQTEAYTAWATSGTDDPAPDFDPAPRQAALKALGLARAAREGVGASIADIETKIGEAHGELAVVGRHIQAAAADAMIGAFVAEHDELTADAAALRQRQARLFATVKNLQERRNYLQATGRVGEAEDLARSMTPTATRGPVDTGPTFGEVKDHQAAVEARFKELSR